MLCTISNTQRRGPSWTELDRERLLLGEPDRDVDADLTPPPPLTSAEVRGSPTAEAKDGL